MPRDAIRRLFRLPLRRRDLTEARVEEEISFHLEQRTERLIAQGLQPEAARREARRRLGSEHELRSVRRAALRRERRLRVRDWTADLMQDLRHAGRRLRGTPGFTTAALLTLALGIGAATAVFTVVEGVLLRPLPFPEPDRLVRVFEVNPEGDDHNVVSPGNYLDWQGTGAFTVLGAHRYPYGVSLTGEGEAARVRILDVAPAVMEALGRDALLGRRLLPEDAAGDGLVAVLSHGFWRSRFGADREIIGRKLLLNQQSVEVVGVMPEDFRLPTPEPDLYLPLTNGDLDPDERRGHMLYVIGRLA
ncbi:MAG: ABC transporter permease, partial [Gemmatimonadota bacterium]